MSMWINDAARVWWQWMASMLWQASLLIVLISLIDWAVRKWIWPQVRYAVWLLVLLKLVVPHLGFSDQRDFVVGTYRPAFLDAEGPYRTFGINRNAFSVRFSGGSKEILGKNRTGIVPSGRIRPFRRICIQGNKR